MSADELQDTFDDATADLGDAIGRFQEELCFDGDRPSWPKQTRIIDAWHKLEETKAAWSKALIALERRARGE